MALQIFFLKINKCKFLSFLVFTNGNTLYHYSALDFSLFLDILPCKCRELPHSDLELESIT